MIERKQLVDAVNLAIEYALANVHTSTIARIERVNEKTVDVKPVINRVVNGESVELPLFTEVPPLFMQGGSSHTTYPVAVGDYCLLIFTERCFDRWYDGQDFQSPAEFRMHDYSDGIAIIGVNPKSGSLVIPDVITHIGDTYQEGNYEHQGDRVQSGNYDITGDYTQVGNMTIEGDFELTGNMVVNGNITCTGTISAGNFTGLGGGAMTSTTNIETTNDVVADGVSLSTHTHTDSEGGTTSAPN